MTDAKALLGALVQLAGMVEGKPGYEKVDVQVAREGKKIILPADPIEMEIPTAIKVLERVQADEQQVFQLHEVIDAHPYDALVAFNKAMKEVYGWSSPVPTPTFFGPKPPAMVTVRTGPKLDQVMQVPIGSFKLPSIQENIEVGIGPYQNRYALHITAKARRPERHFLLELVQVARKIVREQSIYRGKAIAARVEVNEGSLEQDLSFFDVERVSKEDIILNDDTYEQIQTNLWAPVENTNACRKHGIPLKRGVLLEGKYGTGKSLTARVTAKVCEDNGWTFLHIDDVRGLRAALVFAEQYAPCVVFAEDIDRVLSERDDAANAIVNTLDGVLSKNAEVFTVLTTNHVENITQVMLRPGRLDAIVSITPPDAKTCERLIRVYGRGLIAEDADLSAACQELAGQIPATIREVVERSKLAMISRKETRVSGDALRIAARTMTQHLELLNAPKNEPTEAEKLYASFTKMVATASNGDLNLEGFDHQQHDRQTKNVTLRSRNELLEKINNEMQGLGKRLDKLENNVVKEIRAA